MVVGIIFVACSLNNKVTLGRVFIFNFVITKVWQIFVNFWEHLSNAHPKKKIPKILKPFVAMVQKFAKKAMLGVAQ